MPEPGWRRIADFAPEDILCRLADEPTLLALDGGGVGCTTIAWRVRSRPVRGLADCLNTTGHLVATASHGWSAPQGGSLVQFDYELPAGPWSGNADAGLVTGWRFDLGPCLRRDPDGRCWFFGTAADWAATQADLSRPPAAVDCLLLDDPRPAWSPAEHHQRVAAIQRRIAAGDLYQANLTMPFHARVRPEQHPDLALWFRLQGQSPGCHGAFIRHAGRTVLSHSPECFLQAHDGVVRSDPIKGTRARQPGQEAAVTAELLSAAKDHAELAMIVDLVRNDLGRIAIPGGVTVRHPAAVMDLPYVHHLYASVVAEARPDCRPADLLAAAFPPGSITGAPKIAAMHLLRDLEAGPRGPYCGSIGWLGERDCCLSVAIRTMVLTGADLRFDAGGGIVADSDPAAEWAELVAKAGPMLRACQGVPA